MKHQKLTPAQAEEIRRLYVTMALSQTQIARRFEISSVTVNRIVNQKTHQRKAK